jgi:hypothetical protein
MTDETAITAAVEAGQGVSQPTADAVTAQRRYIPGHRVPRSTLRWRVGRVRRRPASARSHDHSEETGE